MELISSSENEILDGILQTVSDDVLTFAVHLLALLFELSHKDSEKCERFVSFDFSIKFTNHNLNKDGALYISSVKKISIANDRSFVKETMLKKG